MLLLLEVSRAHFFVTSINMPLLTKSMFRKYVGANEPPFTTKELHKDIIKRSKSEDNLLKSKIFPEMSPYSS